MPNCSKVAYRTYFTNTRPVPHRHACLEVGKFTQTTRDGHLLSIWWRLSNAGTRRINRVAYSRYDPQMTSLRRAGIVAGLALLAGAVLAPSGPASADNSPHSTGGNRSTTPVTCTSADQLAAADAYIAALGDRTKAYDVPLAPHAVRYENGLQTGFSGPQMQRDLDLHLQYSVMTTPEVSQRTTHFRGDPDLLEYRFVVPVVMGGTRIVDAPTVETFRIPRSTCMIERIDATITIAPA